MPTQKFKALVHFIIDECGDPARLGAIRLNKICWYADTICYKTTGLSISGERYVKRQMGPVPASILAALRDLQSEEAIVVSDRDFGRYRRRDFMSLRGADSSRLSDEEQDIVREVMSVICDGHSANSISEMSHDQIWEAAGTGEEIPLTATLAARPGEISNAVMAWADTMVVEIEQEKTKAA